MNMSSKTMGILAIAALLGIVALIISINVLDWSGFWSFIVGLIVGVITWVVLWLGWGDDTPEQSGFGSATGWTDPKTAKTVTKPAAPVASTSSGATEATVIPASSATKTEASTSKTAEVKPASKNGSKPASSATKVSKPAAKTEQPVAKTKPAAKPKPADKPAAAKTAKPAVKAKPAAKPAAATPTDTPTTDLTESKPETLTTARAEGADDLKRIKGVGPGIEKTLNELGFYHYDQIAAWGDAEVQWVDSRLKFKGRIVRDGWIAQASDLAKG